MNTSQLSAPADLSLSSFEAACHQLGRPPLEVLLVCPVACGDVAESIQKQFYCSLLVIPDVLTRNQFSWGVTAGQSWVYSDMPG